MARLSALASGPEAETAFTVLAVARRLKARGKDVVELEIGDSPFPSTPHAKAAGIRAIEENQTGYCPCLGLPEFREAAARVRPRRVRPRRSRPRTSSSASGAKLFEQFFCEAFLDPGDGVLVFSPHFPTYVPNLERRGARAVLVPLARRARVPAPCRATSSSFLDDRPEARGRSSSTRRTTRPAGVATRDDLAAIADLVRGTDLAVFSDEPYCHMVWEGRHESILAQPGMLDQAVAAYTFSKSYSMSGWRLGFAVAHPEVVEAIGKMINTSASCSPPFVAAGRPGGARARRADPRRVHGPVPPQGRAARRRPGDDRGLPGRRARGDLLRLPRRPRRSATAWGSPRTAWRCTCSKGPTTTSASPAWAASASARPGGASSASAAPSPTSGSTRPSPSSPRRSTAATGSSGS